MANLFYNMSTRKVELVGAWDVVAFDEAAGIKFKDKDGIQIMKDFMASGSFSRGRDLISANAAMVFVGNINQSVDVLVKTGHLFAPFPDEMIDAAFFDRVHAYLPGWEIPKMRPEFLTNQYGLIVDFLAEFFREMRKHPVDERSVHPILFNDKPPSRKVANPNSKRFYNKRYYHELRCDTAKTTG